jgi:pyrroloquinoline quinone biosynthesis protein D
MTTGPLLPALRQKLGLCLIFKWDPAQDCHVLLYPEGMIKLNRSAGEILSRCDGERDLTALVADLEQAFQASDLAGEVQGFLEMARQHKWVDWS